MEKIFYISKGNENGDASIPTTDRFQRIEKMNMLLNSGWKIKEFVNSGREEYFLLEKAEV